MTSTPNQLNEITEQMTKAAKDALYVSIGLGVLAFQKAQVQRHDLTKTVEAGLSRGREQFTKLAANFEGPLGQFDAQVDAIEARLDNVLDGVQARLPKPAADAIDQVRKTAKAARTQVRDLVRSAA